MLLTLFEANEKPLKSEMARMARSYEVSELVIPACSSPTLNMGAHRCNYLFHLRRRQTWLWPHSIYNYPHRTMQTASSSSIYSDARTDLRLGLDWLRQKELMRTGGALSPVALRDLKLESFLVHQMLRALYAQDKFKGSIRSRRSDLNPWTRE